MPNFQTTMYRTVLRANHCRRGQVLSRPFTVSSTPRGIIQKDRDDTLDPAKEHTDTLGQAKDQSGSNPAQQQANVVKQQSGKSGAAQTQATSDSELTEKKKRGEIAGRKPGEEAVNPAVKQS